MVVKSLWSNNDYSDDRFTSTARKNNDFHGSSPDTSLPCHPALADFLML